MLVRALFITIIALAAGVAWPQSSGPPDTIASCLGKDDCARCTLFTPSSSVNKIVVRPAQASCAQKLTERSLFAVSSVDQQVHAYGRFDTLNSSAAIQTMYTNLGTGRGVGAPLGSTGVVLASQMHQNYEAARASDVTARVNSIAAAINKSSASLKSSFESTKAQLPATDAAVKAHLEQTAALMTSATLAAASNVVNLSSAPKEPLPPRASDAQPFLTHGLSEKVIRQRVAAEIPEQHRRAAGQDLAGSTNRSGGGAAAQARREAAKLRVAQAKGEIPAKPAARMLSQLDAAVRLSESPYAKGRAIGDRIVADVESERQVTQGKSETREISTVDADGTIMVVRQPAAAPLPERLTGDVISSLSIRLDLAADRSSQAIAIANAYSAADAVRRRQVALSSKEMAANAAKSLMQGNLGDAEVWTEAAILVADVASSWVPALSVGRGCYEIVAGRDLFTGAELSDLEIAGRIIDVAMIGFGSKITKGFEAVNRIAQKNDKYSRIFASAKKYSDRMAKLGSNPRIDPVDLAHIADKHMPGGLNHIDEVVDGVAHNATVFNKDVDPLDLAGEAIELIHQKHPSIQNVPSRSKGSSDFFLWNRKGLDPERIGYSAATAEPARDVGIIIDRQEGRLKNIYPWNPNNREPDLKGWD